MEYRKSIVILRFMIVTWSQDFYFQSFLMDIFFSESFCITYEHEDKKELLSLEYMKMDHF